MAELDTRLSSDSVDTDLIGEALKIIVQKNKTQTKLSHTVFVASSLPMNTQPHNKQVHVSECY